MFRKLERGKITMREKWEEGKVRGKKIERREAFFNFLFI
jgi:hypothetical protein